MRRNRPSTTRLLRSALIVALVSALLNIGTGPAPGATLGVAGVRVTGYVVCNHSSGSGEAPTSLELDVKGTPNAPFAYQLPYVGNNTAQNKPGPTYEISFMAYIPKGEKKATIRNRVNCDGDWGQLNSGWRTFQIDRKRAEIRRNFCLNGGLNVCDPKVATALGQCIVGAIAGDVPLDFKEELPSPAVHETIQAAFARLFAEIKNGKYRALGVALGCLPLNVDVQSTPVQPRVSPIEPTLTVPEMDLTAAEPISPAPIAPNTGFQVVTDRSAAFLQAQPTNGALTVAQFGNGTPITIICQTAGDRAGVAPFPDNATWDYVTIDGLTGYISDMRTNTAGDGVRTNLPNGGYFLSTQGIPQCQNSPQQPTPNPVPVTPKAPVTPAPTTPVIPAPTTQVTPTPTTPTAPAMVSVSQGGNPGSPQCTDASCAFLNVSVANMAAPYNVQCWNDHGGWSAFASYTTNSSSSAQCFMGWANAQVYAVVNGVRSNTVSWDPRRPVAPPPTAPPTPTGPAIVGTYTITTDRPVAFLQAQPLNSAATLATFPNGTTVEMICQTSGDQTGVQPFPTNATWDYVRVGGQLGYIADMRLNTPGTGPRTNLPNGGYFFPSAGIPTC